MSTAEAIPETTTAEHYRALRAAHRADPNPSVRRRKALLSSLLNAMLESREEYARCISADFGNRSWHESMLAEVWVSADNIRHTSKHLKKWARTQTVSTPLAHRPGYSRIVPQPKGVVGVISPWNYPLLLSIDPIAAAIAAGCRVAFKPSELTPRTSAFLAQLLERALPLDWCRVIQGDADVGREFSSMPWDHLFFTGSPRVGKMVMQAASANLTPVTLELGGKSPVLVTPGFDLQRAANRIIFGKTLNSGQTCLAPDYVLVHEDDRDALVEAMEADIESRYPTLRDNPDYSHLATDTHHKRLHAILEDAREAGATIRTVNPGNEDLSGTRCMAPSLILDCPDTARAWQEELFGPILMVRTYSHIDEALDYMWQQPRPLALYLFDDDLERTQTLLETTYSGGVTVNDTLVHVSIPDLPFGGTGNSGLGSYHGKQGFDTFTHYKSVFYQGRVSLLPMFDQPWGTLVTRASQILINGLP